MEIEFDGLMYKKNNKETSHIYLNSLNYKFLQGTVYALVGDASEIIGKLLVLDKRPTKGSVSFNGVMISKTAKVENIDVIKKDLRYIDFRDSKKFSKSYFLDELNELLNGRVAKNVSDMAIKSLVMVGLDESYIERNLFELSSTESKKVLLALNLCLNPKVLVLNDFERGLLYKDRMHFKRLFNKLKVRYNKMIVLISSDVTFMFELVDKVLVVDEGKLILEGGNEIYYNNEFYKYIEKPQIVDFIMYANSLEKEILPYIDNKELLKGIYRDIENKK